MVGEVDLAFYPMLGSALLLAVTVNQVRWRGSAESVPAAVVRWLSVAAETETPFGSADGWSWFARCSDRLLPNAA